MTDLAENILKYIDRKGEAKSTDLAREFNESVQRIVGAIKSLECLGDIVEASIETVKHWELTNEGKLVKQSGSHEAVVYGLVPAGGIGQAQLMMAAGPLGKVGFSKAMSAGWLIIDKSGGQPVVKRKVQAITDTVREHLVLICEGKDSGLSDKERIEYKKRKLVEEVTEKIYVLKKGSCFTTTVEKPETDLTADMISSGSWKTTNFKAYNLDSLGIEIPRGNLHPLLKVRREYRQIFLEMGFKEMPTNNFVESSFWNFDALFQPQQHPARDAHDTFFISDPATSSKFPKEYMEKVRQVHSKGGFGSQGYGYDWSIDEASKNLLRTHTTAVSARMLYKLANQKEFTPQKYFSIDRVFRNETLDATHLAEFHQIEGVIADRGLTLGDLIGVLNQFFNKLGIEKLRFKPAYNPYTEPSMEIFSYHEGLGKWMELGNSGIFRPEMLLPMGLPPDVNVIAWGLSLERPTMIKYKIDNIRDLVGHKVNLKMVQDNPLCRLDKSNDDAVRQLQTLDKRWNKVESSLDILKKRVLGLGINPDNLKTSKLSQFATTATTSKDMVIFAHPSRPPYSVQLLATQLSAKMSISCSTHLHSSLPAKGPSLLPSTTTPRSHSSLHLTLIWADVPEPYLVFSPPKTIQGEVNICRYLSRALEGCQGGYWYENLPLEQVMAVDMVLDTLAAANNKHSALKALTQFLSHSTFMAGEKPTAADLVALSLVKMEKIELPAVDKWIEHLANQFPSAFQNCRSLIAERLLEATLKDTPVNCKYHANGCLYEDLVINLEDHESGCMFRSVKCPASHRGACNWMGPLNKLRRHVIQQKCAQVVKAKPPDSYFVSTIADFAQDQTVFSKSIATHWKPVMLISQEALRFFCYAIFYRDSQGSWFAYVRSFAPPSVTSTLRVEIRIKKSGCGLDYESFLYQGSVSSSDATEQEILDSGSFLVLRDGQVKKFMVEKTIMEYNITLKQMDLG